MGTKSFGLIEVFESNEDAISNYYGNVTVCGNVLTFYMRFVLKTVNVGNGTDGIGTIRDAYAPVGHAVPFMFISGNGPYNPINGGAWLEGNKKIQLYGIETNKPYFIYGTWMI